MRGSARRCVLLFARTAQAEARAKGLRGAEALFDRAAQRIYAAVEALADVDLVVAGAAPTVSSSTVVPQRGTTLRTRLNAAFDDAFALGYRQVVAVGLDSPQLTYRHLSAAFEALERRAAVFGPCPDGGVYLVGLTHHDAHAVRSVPWGTRNVVRVLGRLLPLATRLEGLQDVDRPGDLRRAARGDPSDRLLASMAAEISRRPVVAASATPPGVASRRLPESRAPPAG